MVKIGLLGYGKMGKTIEQIATGQGLEIVWRISRDNVHERTADLLRRADVVIEFSRPEVAFENVMACLEAGVPVISGTTGWAEKLSEAREFCTNNHGALLWASNFSIGVNIFFALNRHLAQLMRDRSEYRPGIIETHHIYKLDAPSGTALTLVQELIETSSRYTDYRLITPDTAMEDHDHSVPVTAIRQGEVPGTHQVSWKSAVDEITIEHRADSRAGFALGAVAAACWIVGKQGVFTMGDVLNIR